MSDYSESGAQPVEDAAVPDPPTVDEVLAERDERDRRSATSAGDDEAPVGGAATGDPSAAEEDDG